MEASEQLRQLITNIGRPNWSILIEIINAPDFDSILTDQQNNVLRAIRENPHTLKSYSSYIPDIIAKYYGWKIYKDSKLEDLTQNVDSLSKKINASAEDLSDLNRVVKLASGAHALAAYSKIFFESSQYHQDNAKNRFKWYIISLIILLIAIGLIFFFSFSDLPYIKDRIAEDIKYNLTISVLIFKALVAFFFFQVVQFFRKSYNAEKHLEEVYKHRSDVLQSLHAVYNSIEDKSEKDSLLRIAALYAFERGETGYITTKEGAGSGENESILAQILNK
jgi:hypothetical protein